MTLGGTLLGGGFGIWTVIYANWIRKMPIFYRPWEHVLMFGSLAYVGHRMSQATIFLEERVMMEAKRRINANQGKLDAEYRAILGEKYYNKWFPEGTESSE